MKCKLLILSLLALSLTACGSKRLKSNQAQEDITRPPTIEISKDGTTNESIEKLVSKESNETVSYGEWLKESASKTPTTTPKAVESADEGISYGEQIEKITAPTP